MFLENAKGIVMIKTLFAWFASLFENFDTNISKLEEDFGNIQESHANGISIVNRGGRITLTGSVKSLTVNGDKIKLDC